MIFNGIAIKQLAINITYKSVTNIRHFVSTRSLSLKSTRLHKMCNCHFSFSPTSYNRGRVAPSNGSIIYAINL